MPVFQFALIIDGTQDISGVEQESICLNPHRIYQELIRSQYVWIHPGYIRSWSGVNMFESTQDTSGVEQESICLNPPRIYQELIRSQYVWIHPGYIRSWSGVNMFESTQDISGVDQESICLNPPRIYQELIRSQYVWLFVDADLQPKEEFLGLYEVSSTTGQNIAQMACDVMMRLGLPLSQLPGQTYEGDTNIAGWLQGVQDI